MWHNNQYYQDRFLEANTYKNKSETRKQIKKQS